LIHFLSDDTHPAHHRLNSFCLELNKQRHLLGSHRTLMGVAIHANGHANTALRFFSQRTGASRSKGEEFINQIDHILSQHKTYFDRIKTGTKDSASLPTDESHHRPVS
jgi:hypothetical protein